MHCVPVSKTVMRRGHRTFTFSFTVSLPVSVCVCYCVRGYANKINSPKIRVYYGSGWVGPGFIRNFFF